ncbi:Uncharacterised protein [Streptococcus pneumoniae]|nr:Uncharacterised protein [Streptococcus pneumoniae]
MFDLEGFFVLNLDLATFDKFFCFRLSLGTFFFTTFFFSQTVKDGNSTDFSKTNGRKEGFFCLVAGLLQNLIHVTLVHEFIGHIAIFLELGHQHLTTLVDRQFLILIFKELANLVARLAGLDHIEPVTARSKGVGVGDNFNLIPCLELGCQRNHTTIDLGTSRFFTDFGMNFVGKVNRS